MWPMKSTAGEPPFIGRGWQAVVSIPFGTTSTRKRGLAASNTWRSASETAMQPIKARRVPRFPPPQVCPEQPQSPLHLPRQRELRHARHLHEADVVEREHPLASSGGEQTEVRCKDRLFDVHHVEVGVRSEGADLLGQLLRVEELQLRWHPGQREADECREMGIDGKRRSHPVTTR